MTPVPQCFFISSGFRIGSMSQLVAGKIDSEKFYEEIVTFFSLHRHYELADLRCLGDNSIHCHISEKAATPVTRKKEIES